jgi:hypothetical protein
MLNRRLIKQRLFSRCLDRLDFMHWIVLKAPAFLFPAGSFKKIHYQIQHAGQNPLLTSLGF